MVVGDVTTAVSTLVLGGGPGGYVAAIRAAQLGQSVTLVDSGTLGGVCLNSGCIPLKALLSAAERYHEARPAQLQNMGITSGEPTLDFAKMQSWKDSVVARLSGGVAKLLAAHKIEVVHGKGWFLKSDEMRVEGEYGSLRYSFENCVVAVGAEAVTLPGLPFDGKQVLSAQMALALTALPPAVTIAGDDYIALELVTTFARLGVAVTLLVPGERPLPQFEATGVRLVQAAFRKLGVQIVTNARPVGTTETQVVYKDAKEEKQAPLPLIVSAGVRPNTSGLNLAAPKLKTAENGALLVNNSLQTTQKHIYAVGDCNGIMPIATSAFKQAKVAAEALTGRRVEYAPQAFPLVVHTSPEIASVGYTSEAATAAGFQIKTGRFALAANGRALTLGQESGTALVVAEAESGVILGMTVVAPRAGDLISEATLAIEMGATLTDLAEILHPHPGLSELLMESAEAALGQVIHQF